MSLDLSFLHKSLKAKGFKIKKEGDHYYGRFYLNDKIVTNVRSKVGGLSKKKYKTLGDPLVSRIYQTLHFDNKKQFMDFLECPYSREDYQGKLLEIGLIDLR